MQVCSLFTPPCTASYAPALALYCCRLALYCCRLACTAGSLCRLQHPSPQLIMHPNHSAATALAFLP
jgi:hypothetical protein